MPGVRVDANVGGSDAGMNASSDPGSALLEVRGLSKSFGTLRALQEVDFTLRAGEIHALLGENGAGKSTLIKAVTGVFPRDAGIVRLGGAEVAPRSAKAAVDAGIATVYQEVNLLLNLSVAQNLYLGRQPTRFGLVREAEMRRCATELLAEFDLHIDVAEPLGNYSVAVQHIAAIARAVDQSARVLILDEPTASLDRHEVEILFAVMRKLALRGIGVVFVTHFLDQVYEICDRITVLRNGLLIGERTTAELPRIELIRMMLGRELAETTSERAAAQVRQVGEICARFENYGKAGYVAPFDLALRRGEVVALAGLLGSGRTETARLVFGAERADSGSATVDGKPVRLQSPRDAVAHGFGYCPEERKTEGIIADLTVRENIVLALQAKRGLAKPLSRAEQEEIAMRSPMASAIARKSARPRASLPISPCAKTSCWRCRPSAALRSRYLAPSRKRSPYVSSSCSTSARRSRSVRSGCCPAATSKRCCWPAGSPPRRAFWCSTSRPVASMSALTPRSFA